MPRKTEFSISCEAISSLSEEVSACRSSIRSLADSLADVESKLKGSAANDRIRSYGTKISNIRSQMYGSAEDTKLLGEAALFAVQRYQRAEFNLLDGGTESFGKREAGGSGQKPEEESGGSVTPGSGTSDGGTDSGSGSGGSGGSAPISGGSSDNDSKDDRPGKKYNTDENQDKWSAWSNEETQAHYKRANIKYEWNEETGKYDEIVTDYYGKTESKWEVGFFTPIEKTASENTKVGGWEKGINDYLDNNWNKNKFKKDDDSTWDKRVYKSTDKSAKNLERTTDEDEMNDNSFSEDRAGGQIFGFQKQVSATLLGGDHRAKGKGGEAGVSYALLTAEAHTGASVGVYYVEKDGKKCLAMGADVQAGASATVFKVDADAQTYWKPGTDWLGEDFQVVGAKAAASVSVGRVAAQGSAKCRIIDGQPEIVGEFEAGAYACQASASGSLTLAGVTATAKASVNIGIGVNAKVGLTGGKLRCELGASLGIGFKISFELDFSGLIDGVKNLVSKAATAIADGVKKVGKAIGSAAKAVGKFLTSW